MSIFSLDFLPNLVAENRGEKWQGATKRGKERNSKKKGGGGRERRRGGGDERTQKNEKGKGRGR